MKSYEILSNAAEATKDRQQIYGSPKKNFERIARLWNVWLQERGYLHENASLKPEDIVMMSTMIKQARLMESIDHLDSWTDTAGYAGTGAEIVGEDAGPDAKQI